jgi:hypothetical protein
MSKKKRDISLLKIDLNSAFNLKYTIYVQKVECDLKSKEKWALKRGM